MRNSIIKVEGLSKRYVLEHQARAQSGYYSYKRFSDVLIDFARKPIRWVASQRSLESGAAASNYKRQIEEFWALKDISFDVKQGEVIGIIGRNGAGKSTLLKVLSRITEPTKGRIEIDGRVASLLEVGTGFHPELTGRENIYLNGAILGMHKSDIRRKFDEIVAFAEVEKFLDTPVKRYSSGMYVRLAFAVAAHLEPEILVVDEVLAVGDGEFQKKCLGKMQDVATKQGRTVLFVSHNMGAVQRLCSNSILLDAGRMVDFAPTDEILSRYLSGPSFVGSSVDLTKLPASRRRGSAKATFTRIELFSSDGRLTQEIRQGEPMVVRLHIKAKREINNILFGISFVATDGTEVMGSAAHEGGGPNYLSEGTNVFECEIRPMILCPGRYVVRGAIFQSAELFDHIDEMVAFDVLNIAFNKESAPQNRLVGNVYVPYKWQVQSISNSTVTVGA